MLAPGRRKTQLWYQVGVITVDYAICRNPPGPWFTTLAASPIGGDMHFETRALCPGDRHTQDRRCTLHTEAVPRLPAGEVLRGHSNYTVTPTSLGFHVNFRRQTPCVLFLKAVFAHASLKRNSLNGNVHPPPILEPRYFWVVQNHPEDLGYRAVMVVCQAGKP